MLIKLQNWIERIPWYIHGAMTVYFLARVLSNPENTSLVILSTIGAASFTYLTVHRLIAE